MNQIQQGEHTFAFKNGDVYQGQFCAHKSGLVWREGLGTYTTHDGQKYTGLWRDDQLEDGTNLAISYPNGHRYLGAVLKFKYGGPGTYIFENGDRLTCRFENNVPIGEIILVDHQGRCWYGKVSDNSTFLFKQHVFYADLDEQRGKGLLQKPPPVIEESLCTLETSQATISSTYSRLKEEKELELKRRVFAKSNKTVFDNMKKDESEWIAEFRNFRKLQKIVNRKMATTGISSLTNEQLQWYNAYCHSMEILENRKLPKKLLRHHCDLLRDFLSDAYKTSCPALRIYTAHWGEGGA